jgi:hypothetical protein
MVPGQHGVKSLQDPISTEKKLGVVAHACHPSNSKEGKIESQARPVWAKSETLSPK